VRRTETLAKIQTWDFHDAKDNVICYALSVSFTLAKEQPNMTFFSLPPRPGRLWGPPSLHPVRWSLEGLYLGVKLSGCEAGHLSPSSTKVKNAWSCISTYLTLPYTIKFNDPCLCRISIRFAYVRTAAMFVMFTYKQRAYTPLSPVASYSRQTGKQIQI
jgi:hypothetical protein